MEPQQLKVTYVFFWSIPFRRLCFHWLIIYQLNLSNTPLTLKHISNLIQNNELTLIANYVWKQVEEVFFEQLCQTVSSGETENRADEGPEICL